MSLTTAEGQRSRSAGTSGWLLPSVGHALLVGLLGIATKLALKDLRWPELVLWVAVVYGVIAIVLLSAGRVRLQRGPGSGFAALSGLFVASGLLLLFLALENGDAGQVVPVTAAYPVVTAAAAAAVLAERITPMRAIGTLLVLAGVALLGIG